MCGAVRIVLDLSDLSGNARFVTLKVDNSVKSLVTSSPATERLSVRHCFVRKFGFSVRAVIFRVAFGVNSSRVRYV